MELTCLIVDDSAEFLAAAAARLEPQGVRVVGLASSGDEALVMAREQRPGLALVDVRLGDESGFDVARRLSAGDRPPRVILVSAQAEEDLPEPVAAAPVAGFLPKHRISAAAIRQLLARRDDAQGRG